MAKNKWKAMVSECMPAMAGNLNIGTEHLGSAKGKDCFFCGKPAKENEHLLEKSNGGNNTKYNVVPVCHDHRKPSRVTNKDLYTEDELKKIKDFWIEEKAINPHRNKHPLYAAIMRRYIIDAQNQMLNDFPELQEYLEYQERDFSPKHWPHYHVYKEVNKLKP